MHRTAALLGAVAALGMGQAAAEVHGRGTSGHLDVIYWQAISTMNPYLSGSTKEMNAASLVLEPLARFDPQARLVPWLADDIPTLENGGVSADLTSITWVLREGLVWSDGTPVTSADVAFTHDYCTHPEGGCAYRDRFAGIARIDTPDDRTVTITFEDPTPNPHVAFVGAGAPILQKAQFAPCLGPRAPECTEQNFHPIGTGPYRVANFRPNDVVEFVMNEAYRVPNQPHFATITWAGGGDPLGAARAVLQTGEMDYAWNLQLAPEVLARMLEGGRGELLVGFGSLMERLVFNLADPSPDLPGALREARARPHPILSDIRVREALSLALDRRAMTEIGFGEMGRPTCNFIVAPPAMVSPNTDGCLVQDMARANALLDAAGWERGPDGIRVKDGRRLELLFQTSTNAVRQDFQALIQQWWREIGVETRLRNIDAGVFFGADPASPDTFTQFRADVQMYANFFEGADPSRHLEAHRCGRAPEPGTQWQGQNINRFCTDTAEALWAALDREPDLGRRAELVIAINDLIVQDFAVLPLVARGTVSARATTLGGVAFNVWDSQHWNQAEWYRIAE